jgi:FKBP-type peptidyl-prolyl cis-trans isomerase 2
MIDKNNIIEIDLIVKDSNTKELLDTTMENIAKEGNIHSQDVKYIPLKIIFGRGELLASVEDYIKDMAIGQTKSFSLSKDKAFGDKDPNKVRLMQLNDFKKEKINPEPGMHVNLGNEQGKVISVSGGRVKVDVNHELSGRDLDYTITLKSIFTSNKEKADALIEKIFYFLPKGQIKAIVSSNNNELEIILPGNMPQEIDYFKHLFSHLVFEVCNFENIKYSEVVSRKELEQHNH